MEAIFSSTALATRQREVKDAANEGVVRITENGNGAFVFMGERVFEDIISRERAEAAYEARVEYVMHRSEQDFASGRHVVGLDALRSAVDARRAAAAARG